jgi:hypothetical protein
MQIKKIKVLGDGLKGLSIIYNKTEDKDGRSFNTDVTENKHYPIHLGLENKLKELREYCGEICGLIHGSLEEAERKYIINDIDVIGLKITNETFLISGKYNTFFDKKIAINTPLMTEDDEYEHFDKVQKIIGELLEEVIAYYDGTKKATDTEIAYKIIKQQTEKGKETISPEQFDAMSEAEQKAFCTEYLEKKGSMVTHIEDFELDEDSATVLQLQKVG